MTCAVECLNIVAVQVHLNDTATYFTLMCGCPFGSCAVHVVVPTGTPFQIGSFIVMLILVLMINMTEIIWIRDKCFCNNPPWYSLTTGDFCALAVLANLE